MPIGARRKRFKEFFEFEPSNKSSSTDLGGIISDRNFVRNRLVQLCHQSKQAEREGDVIARDRLEKAKRRLWQLAKEFNRLPSFQDEHNARG